MDRGDILSGDAFAAVLRSAFGFIVVLVAFGWVTLDYVERNLIAELGDDVQHRWDIIAAEHDTEGSDHVMEAITDLSQRIKGGHHALALFGDGDTLIAGNIKTLPSGTGLQIGPLDHTGATPDDYTREYIHFTGNLNDRTLTVGLRLDLLYRTQVLVFRALMLSGFIWARSLSAFAWMVVNYFVIRTIRPQG